MPSGWLGCLLPSTFLASLRKRCALQSAASFSLFPTKLHLSLRNMVLLLFNSNISLWSKLLKTGNWWNERNVTLEVNVLNYGVGQFRATPFSNRMLINCADNNWWDLQGQAWQCPIITVMLCQHIALDKFRRTRQFWLEMINSGVQDNLGYIYSCLWWLQDASERKIRFTSNYSPKELFEKIEDIVIGMGFRVQKRNGKVSITPI